MIEYNFLIEIGTDELPPNILKQLGIDFLNYIKNELIHNNIDFNAIKWFASPRHLAVTAKILVMKKCLSNISNDNYNYNYNYNYVSQHKINIHHQSSNQSINHTSKQLPKLNNKNNLLIMNPIHDKYLHDLLKNIVSNALSKLTNYETMRWGNVQTAFIRPVNTITILLDSYLVPGYFFEINTDRIIYGHRYIKNNRIIINHARDYPNILVENGKIIVDYNIRKNIIKTDVQKKAAELGGIVDMRNDNFLEHITSLIEWPTVLFGKFHKRFLSLPSEILIHIMQDHQKYFPVYNIINGILLPYFIFVVNTITNNYKKIIMGHENILKIKFMDAEFFLNNDNQYRLEDYIPKLNLILFHRKLGSMRDKVYRIEKLSGWIATQIKVNVLTAKRAGYLCKCDLMTDMVLEFPKVQGIIGMYYARRDGELEQVAIAQKDHYQPQCIDNPIPIEDISCVVSIADKMDTISGIFGIKELPSSSRDPFALKRAASGILNIIIQKKLPINLNDLIHESIKLYGSCVDNSHITQNNIKNFMCKRLYACYALQGYKTDIIKSILSTKYNDINDCSAHIHAIQQFREIHKKEYIQLHMIYKRLSNILKKQNIFENYTKIKPSFFKAPEEKSLFIQITNMHEKIPSLFINKAYDIALNEIVNLSKYTNDFLNSITVLDKNENIKYNRLLLIYSVKFLILKVIDLSVLHITI